MQFCKDGREQQVSLDGLTVGEDHLNFLYDEASVEVLHQFKGYVLKVREGEHDDCTHHKGPSSPCQYRTPSLSHWYLVLVMRANTALEVTFKNNNKAFADTLSKACTPGIG